MQPAQEQPQKGPTKITLVYNNPSDPTAFEAAYPEQLALAKSLIGVTHIQASKVWPKEDGSPTPFYRLLDIYFDSYEAASAAVADSAATAFFNETFKNATEGVEIAFAEVLEDS